MFPLVAPCYLQQTSEKPMQHAPWIFAGKRLQRGRKRVLYVTPPRTRACRREHQRPQREKKSPNCADDAPVRGARARARATCGSIINTIGLTFLPNCGLLPAKNSEKQCKVYYSHDLAWVMHSEPFACWSCSTGGANAGSWS